MTKGLVAEQAVTDEVIAGAQASTCPECGQQTGTDTEGSLAGPSIDTSRNRGQQRLAAIARAASSVADAASLSVTLNVVAREILRADDHIAAAQVMRVTDNGSMRIIGRAGFVDFDDFAQRLEECRRLGARLMHVEALKEQHRVVVPHRREAVLSDPNWAPLHKIMSGPSWDGFAAVPLVVRGRAVGVLNAFYLTGWVPGPNDLEFLEAMADQAAMAVDSADLLATSRHDAQEAERARLARELHDSVVQQVFSMRMQAKALRAQVEPGRTSSPERVRAVADELLDLAQNALADLRGLVLQLHPVELLEHGLAGAVRHHASSVQTASGLRVNVDIEPGAEPAQLPTELQEDLFRIVQEALHNVVKHAGASQATVRIRAAGPPGQGQVLVEVSDNGSGLSDADPRAGALGLVSMRERAQRWGGRMEIGNDEQGCRVRVRVPAGRPDGGV